MCQYLQAEMETNLTLDPSTLDSASDDEQNLTEASSLGGAAAASSSLASPQKG